MTELTNTFWEYVYELTVKQLHCYYIRGKKKS
uniref:Uncharacterized protein n=1 Tax=Rhizophora mucronata TaxID=61149 RepID=A0A2P2N827_RHIMU